ncbi:MAG TPA: hypothetical protein PKM41_08990 [Deltaproteobacteria bacterium]|jgi:predicted anti-sigma-YlaC factor YlaD|nr:hypothetical protein [Deltaproteobacteria bacterium]HOI07413.1 hypothetical protein [Deltaproteobacteria bacterium]
MSQDERVHVSPEELASSVTGLEGLDPRVADHLQTCPVCRVQREELLEDLRALGRTARECAPQPSRTIVLPEAEARRTPARWGFGLGLAAAAAAAVILVFSAGNLVDHRSSAPFIAAGEALDDQELMYEVALLEENALPEAYQRISPEESTAWTDDETLDFVVPIDDDNGLS